MHLIYDYADLTIASIVPLPALSTSRQATDVSPDFRLGWLSSPPDSPNLGWSYCWHTDSGAPALFVAKSGEDFLLCFPDLACFAISGNGDEIGVWPLPHTNDETVRHLLLDQVLPRLLAHRGRFVLHAGAVRVNGRAIAFIGETGAGKSTLTASLYAAGYPLLSDDGIVLLPDADSPLALCTYPSLRLWPDAVIGLFVETPALAPMAHYSTKQRVILEKRQPATQPLPLAALYLLAPAAEARSVTLTRLSARDTCMAIIQNAFQLDPTDHDRAAGLLAAASDVAERVPAFTLTYPRHFANLPAVHAAILEQHRYDEISGNDDKA